MMILSRLYEGAQLPGSPADWAAGIALALAIIAFVALGTRKDWF